MATGLSNHVAAGLPVMITDKLLFTVYAEFFRYGSGCKRGAGRRQHGSGAAGTDLSDQSYSTSVQEGQGTIKKFPFRAVRKEKNFTG